VCVPLGTECDVAAKQIGAEAGQVTGSCTTVVRLSYTTLAPIGWQLFCGGYFPPDEMLARATAEKFTGYGDGAGAQLLGAAPPSDEWMFWEAPGDFGGVGVVSARNGMAVFGGSIIWMGGGAITHPTEWREPASLGFGCASSGPGFPSARGFDLNAGSALSQNEIDQALGVVWSSALPVGLSMVHSVFDAVVLLYPPSVGVLDPSVAEYVVLVNSGWLE
jgi:hypothetical protein